MEKICPVFRRTKKRYQRRTGRVRSVDILARPIFLSREGREMSDSKSIPKAYTLRQVAEALNLNVITLYRRVSDGSLPAVRVGRAIRIPAAVLEALLAPQRQVIP